MDESVRSNRTESPGMGQVEARAVCRHCGEAIYLKDIEGNWFSRGERRAFFHCPDVSVQRHEPRPADHCDYCGWVEPDAHMGTCPTHSGEDKP